MPDKVNEQYTQDEMMRFLNGASTTNRYVAEAFWRDEDEAEADTHRPERVPYNRGL